VCFKDMLTATVARQVYHDIAEKKNQLLVEEAPKQESVRWHSLALSYNRRMVRKCWAWLLTAALTIFWIPPVIAITALTSIDSLSKSFPSLGPLFHQSIVAGFITGTLPALILSAYMGLLPVILQVIAKFEGHVSEGEAQRSVLNKHYLFLLLNVLLVSTVSNSFLQSIDAIIHDPTSIDDRLGESLPQHSTFFISYTLLNGLGTYSWYLSRIQQSVQHGIKLCGKTTPRQKQNAQAPEICRYDIMVPKLVLMIVICFTFSVIAPVILLVGCVTFAYAHNVLRYLLVHVYEPKYEEGGLLWEAVIGHLLLGLGLFQLTLIGLFSVKHGHTQVMLSLPLPLLTLLFRWQLSTRFERSKHNLPMVVASNMEFAEDEVAELLKDAYVQPELLQQRLKVDLKLLNPGGLHAAPPRNPELNQML